LRPVNIIAPFGTTRKAARERVSVLWDTVRADEVIELFTLPQCMSPKMGRVSDAGRFDGRPRVFGGRRPKASNEGNRA
jgi:hypothetical protein